MSTVVTRLIGDKRKWTATEGRTNALPPDYRAVDDDIKFCMWKATGGDGMHTVRVLGTLLADFETTGRGAAVRDVIGTHVAAFCDARRRADAAASCVDRWPASLNADVARRLAE